MSRARLTQRRWELTAEERERLLAAQAAPLRQRDLALALLRRPRLLLAILRDALRGAGQGARDNQELAWAAAGDRMRSLVPDAATGAIWFGEDVFTAALEPYLGKEIRALEVGCGDGRIANEIAPRVFELHCCDVSQAMLSEAAGNLASHRNVQLVRSSGLTLEGIESDSFDLAYAHDVLVTLDPDPAAGMLDAMHRALRPGGTCVVSVLTIDRPEWARDQLDRVRRRAPRGRFGPSHPRTYTAGQLDSMMEMVGFEVIDRAYGSGDHPDDRAHYVVTGRAGAQSQP